MADLAFATAEGPAAGCPAAGDLSAGGLTPGESAPGRRAPGSRAAYSRATGNGTASNGAGASRDGGSRGGVASGDGKILEYPPSKKTNEEVAAAFDAHGNSILRLAYSYLHNMEDAEDILQDTLIRYMDKAPAFESEAHEKAWLLRVAANLAKNRIDYNKVRETDELNEELVAEKREDLSFVWDSVKELPVAQREVIHLFYEENLSTAEIAKILKEKESTVRSHLKRGRDKLKTILKEEYDFDEIS